MQTQLSFRAVYLRLKRKLWRENQEVLQTFSPRSRAFDQHGPHYVIVNNNIIHSGLSDAAIVKWARDLRCISVADTVAGVDEGQPA